MRTLMDFFVEVIGSREALVLILVRFCFADIGVAAGRPCELLLEEFMLCDEVVQSIVFA